MAQWNEDINQLLSTDNRSAINQAGIYNYTGTTVYAVSSQSLAADGHNLISAINANPSVAKVIFGGIPYDTRLNMNQMVWKKGTNTLAAAFSGKTWVIAAGPGLPIIISTVVQQLANNLKGAASRCMFGCHHSSSCPHNSSSSSSSSQYSNMSNAPPFICTLTKRHKKDMPGSFAATHLPANTLIPYCPTPLHPNYPHSVHINEASEKGEYPNVQVATHGSEVFLITTRDILVHEELLAYFGPKHKRDYKLWWLKKAQKAQKGKKNKK